MVVEFFEVVVDGFRWFLVVLGGCRSFLLSVTTAQIAPSWPPNEVKHLGSALVFQVEILSRPSNNLKESFLDYIVHIV